VDEYLSEKEQIDQIKAWWKDNGWYLLGGAALAGLLYVGYNQYGAYKTRLGEEAAGVYQQLKQDLDDDDRDGADQLLGRLSSDYPDSPYLDQARLLVAEDNLIRDTDRSISELETVVDHSNDESLVRIARLRLARVLAYDEQFDRALSILDVPDAGEFSARFSEVRGDIHASTGDTEAAISAYTDALLGAGNGSVNRDFVQLKLDELIQAQPPDSGDEG
jgi:predicted negative regulator of RcsB-dependent stress response